MRAVSALSMLEAEFDVAQHAGDDGRGAARLPRVLFDQCLPFGPDLGETKGAAGVDEGVKMRTQQRGTQMDDLASP